MQKRLGYVALCFFAFCLMGLRSLTSSQVTGGGLSSDTANVLTQRNGTAAQTYYQYGTYTDASNYERLAFTWGPVPPLDFYYGTGPQVIAQTVGTGADNLSIQLKPAGTGEIVVGDLFVPCNYLGDHAGNVLCVRGDAFVVGALTASSNLATEASFYLSTKDLVLTGTTATNDTSNAVMITDAAGTTSRQLKASSLRIAATPGGTQLAFISPTGAGTFASLTVGTSGTAITQMRVYTPTLNPASVAASTTAEETYTVTGLTTADKVIVNKPTMTTGCFIGNARVSAADTLALTWGNPQVVGACDPASEVYAVIAIRS